MASDLDALRTLYSLKRVERRGTVGDRFETTAEHVFSACVLAQFLLPRITPALDELRVLKLLLVHDWVEAHAGDTFILDEGARATKKEREREAALALARELPPAVAQEYLALNNEFVAGETREARFARAIDRLDPALHSIDIPSDWTQNGFTEAKVRELITPYLHDFPPLLVLFEEVIGELKRNKAL